MNLTIWVTTMQVMQEKTDLGNATLYQLEGAMKSSAEQFKDNTRW